MKLEPNTYYILANGELMRTFMEDGKGHMIGAIFDPAEEDTGLPASWEAFTWELSGRWDAGRTDNLDVCEKIATSNPFPPIPTRTMDWNAYYDNDEPDDDGNMSGGYGRTEIEAVMDLMMSYPGAERVERMTRGRSAA